MKYYFFPIVHLRCSISLFYLLLYLVCGVHVYGQGDRIALFFPSDESPEMARLCREVVSEFNAQSSIGTIELVAKSGWEEVAFHFRTEVSNKHIAGILMAKHSHALDLYKQTLIMPLEAFQKQDPIFFGQFSTKYMSTVYGENGKLLGIPLFRTIPVLYYNIDKIMHSDCSADLAAGKLPQNWADFETLLVNIKNSTGKTPFLVCGDWYEWVFESMVMQCGGILSSSFDSVRFNSPESIATLNYWKRLREMGLIDTANNWRATMNSFKYQHYPIVSYSTGGIEAIKGNISFRYEVGMLPMNKVKAMSMSGSNLYFSSNMTPAQVRIATSFVKFAYEKKQISQEIAERTGLLSTTQQRAGTPPIDPKISKQLEFAKPNFVTYGYAKVRKILKEAIARAFSGQQNAEQSLNRAQKEATSVLAN